MVWNVFWNSSSPYLAAISMAALHLLSNTVEMGLLYEAVCATCTEAEHHAATRARASHKAILPAHAGDFEGNHHFFWISQMAHKQKRACLHTRSIEHKNISS
ncbi:hypothetical protein ACJX0J_027115 [Zea mays]